MCFERHSKIDHFKIQPSWPATSSNCLSGDLSAALWVSWECILYSRLECQETKENDSALQCRFWNNSWCFFLHNAEACCTVLAGSELISSISISNQHPGRFKLQKYNRECCPVFTWLSENSLVDRVFAQLVCLFYESSHHQSVNQSGVHAFMEPPAGCGGLVCCIHHCGAHKLWVFRPVEVASVSSWLFCMLLGEGLHRHWWKIHLVYLRDRFSMITGVNITDLESPVYPSRTICMVGIFKQLVIVGGWLIEYL